MRKTMNEQELIACFDDAIKFGHIYPLFQPKINHATGRMVGAESLMRWEHPLHGMQYPSDFIPILEKNDLIYRADLCIFESVCKYLREKLDNGTKPVPISVNMSRYDIWRKNYVDAIEEIRQKYNVPVKYLHIEITETSAIGGMELISNVLKKLHSYGYVVEMDDFGSGYSSLNILKDLEVDIIKLDMRFLSGEIGGRGGAIISAIVQMAKWLNTPIIAEGVETAEQANFMGSIGCKYIQGYLYSKPVPKSEFDHKLETLDHEPLTPAMDLISAINANKFWDPTSMETLIFNHFVGGAAIFSYRNGKIEILRVNKKYVKEIGMNMSETEILQTDPLKELDPPNYKIYTDTLENAIKSQDEEVCETWRYICSKSCGREKICTRSHIRMIGHTDDNYLFYAMVQNVTKEKSYLEKLNDDAKIFKTSFEQANIYAWEYIIATKEMHPCFRCMRDLNLPPVVKNYPEPAISAGIFPPDYADMYREWMRKLDSGEVDTLEGIIPLTISRTPFHVRYTLERDENGNPLKAYASATLVVDDKPIDDADVTDKI